uniref:Cns1/TTC4 wheel domain-containing protein n=1 Tax=Aplanochytrium stocchinoi TaxID=215587 RepID=A0A7S3LJR8_9STRA
MASIDYSRFKDVGADEEREEAEKREKLKEARKQAAAENEDSDDEDLHPLFWETIPETKEAEVYTEAFNELIYENRTPDELAQDFKDKGNETFKWGEKFYDKALEYYNEGIHWCMKGETLNVENRKCYVALLSNRAAINLKRKNYGSVIRDCAKAASVNSAKPSTNVKVYYRAARAFYALGRFSEAKVALKHAIDADPENKLVKKLAEEVKSKLKEAKKRKLEKERHQIKLRGEDEIMRKECMKRNIKVGPLIMDIGNYTQETAGTGKFPHPKIASGALIWNVLLMYPEHSTSDYVQQWNEHVTFGEQLELMFPKTKNDAKESPNLVPEWDRHSLDYTMDNLAVFFEERYVRPLDMSKMWEKQYEKARDLEREKEDYTKKHRVRVKVDKSLLEALSDPEYVVPGVPVFYIVSTASPYWKIYQEQHSGRLRIL